MHARPDDPVVPRSWFVAAVVGVLGLAGLSGMLSLQVRALRPVFTELRALRNEQARPPVGGFVPDRWLPVVTAHLGEAVAPGTPSTHQSFAGDTSRDADSIFVGAALPGRSTILVAIAHDCAVCTATMDTLVAMAKRRDVTVDWQWLSLSPADSIAPYAARFGVREPVAVMTDLRTLRLFGIRGTPTYAVIDAHGRVRYSALGGLSRAATRDSLLTIARAAARVVTTDAAGTVRLENLLTGTYDVVVDRALTSTELARLPADDRDASLLTGAASVPLTAPQGASATVPLVATRRGSLVISELFTLTATTTPYGFGTYLEVYNNADTTAYLDGLILGRTSLSMHAGFVNEFPCAEVNAAQRLDPDRLWVLLIWQFPGSGREYAVPPGAGRVVAMDALDHSIASPDNGQVDLSRAHFEEVASDGDPDNVTVPNLIRWQSNTGFFGRGYSYINGPAYALARPPAGVTSRDGLDSVSHVNTSQGGDGGKLYALPRASVLDVFSTDPIIAQQQATGAYAAGFRRCNPWLAPEFERAVANIGNTAEPLANRRKTVGVTPDGRAILQRTRTSARDLERAPPLLRSLRKGQ